LTKGVIFEQIPTLITPAQCRAARGLLDWTQQQLADAAGVGVVTIRQLEADLVKPRHATMVVIQRAFEAAGVAFIRPNGGGAGVRLSKAPKSSAKGYRRR